MKKKVLILLIFLMMLCIFSLAEEDVMISRGDYGEEVIILHQKLIDLGYFNLRAESPFGSRSEEALKAFQTDIGRDVNGLIRDREEYDEILSIENVVRKNLLKDYDHMFSTNSYLLEDYELDGEAVLHMGYSEGENDYINLIKWSNLLEPEADQDYTLSFMAKGTGSVYSFFYPTAVSNGYSNKGSQTKSSDGNIEMILTDDWTLYTITWHTREDVEGEKNILPARVFKGTEMWISKIKFEKGSRATEWVLPEE